MNTFKGKVLAVVAALLLSASAAVASPTTEQSLEQTQLAKKVRKELVTLPWYGVFDNLAYEIDGSTVKLYGQVVQPSTRRDAERRISKIKGVERVLNNIEVLPLSSFDDDIRARTYRALLGWNSPLFRYGRGVNPSVHIIVSGGHVTLEGVVSNEGDRRFAYALVNGVSGVFSVTNNLRAESERAR
jgi:hyperosmotically inducible protein